MAVLLLLFWTLFWKANGSSFLYGEAEPVKKMESVICCCKYHGTNVLRIALRINLLFLFTWFLVTFSFIYTCLAPLSTIILCQPNRPWKKTVQRLKFILLVKSTEENTSLIKAKNFNYIDINKIGLFDRNNRNSRLSCRLHINLYYVFVLPVQHSSSQPNKGTMHVYRWLLATHWTTHREQNYDRKSFM